MSYYININSRTLLDDSFLQIKNTRPIELEKNNPRVNILDDSELVIEDQLIMVIIFSERSFKS